MRWRSSAEKRDSARLFRSMKLCSSLPEGSIFIASRPSVKSICTLCAPFAKQRRISVSCSRQQILDELLARVAGNAFGRIHQAQRGRRDDRLLDRQRGRSASRRRDSCRRSAGSGRARAVSRGMRRDVARGERNLEAVGRGVGEPVHAVGPEVVVLALLAVGDDRRARRLEALDRVADGLVVERIQARIVVAEPCRLPR